MNRPRVAASAMLVFTQSLYAGDAAPILARAADALAAHENWSFQITRKAAGPGAAAAIDLDADASIARTPDETHLGAHLDIRGTYTLATSPAPDPMLLRYDGRQVLSVRERGGVVIVGDPANMGLALLGIAYDAPLFDAIIDPGGLRAAADRASVLAPRTVAGQPCDVVFIEASENEPGSTWYFDTDDALPRRVDVIAGHGPAAYSVTTTISNFRPDEPFPALNDLSGWTRTSFDPARIPAVGDPAPDINITTPDGRAISLNDQHAKVVVVKFWATWCGACVAGLPAMGELDRALADEDRVTILGVNCWDKGDINATMRRAGCDFPSGAAPDDQVASFGVTALPMIFVLDHEGRIAHAQLGYRPDAESSIRSVVDSLLEERE